MEAAGDAGLDLGADIVGWEPDPLTAAVLSHPLVRTVLPLWTDVDPRCPDGP